MPTAEARSAKYGSSGAADVDVVVAGAELLPHETVHSAARTANVDRMSI